jgi:hypothetical protein
MGRGRDDRAPLQPAHRHHVAEAAEEQSIYDNKQIHDPHLACSRHSEYFPNKETWFHPQGMEAMLSQHY